MSTATPLLLLAACLLGGCERGAPGAQAREELAVRARTFDERLAAARQGDGDEPVARWDLPAMLAEISGLALTADGRLLTHGDETGDVYEIDYRTGLVARRFSLGPDPVTEDFEAISVRDSVVTLFTSKARLFEFGEGRNESSVPFTTRELVLDDDCREFEGAAYSADGSTLVLACKTPRGKGKDLLLYRRDASDTTSDRFARIDIPIDSIRARGPTWKEFSASDITIRPDNGHYLLVAGPQRGYLEVTPEGSVVVARSLSADHPQAEGIAMTRDGLLLISDEAANGRASLTVYAAPFR
jgi:hypothetical protein